MTGVHSLNPTDLNTSLDQAFGLVALDQLLGV